MLIDIFATFRVGRYANTRSCNLWQELIKPSWFQHPAGDRHEQQREGGAGGVPRRHVRHQDRRSLALKVHYSTDYLILITFMLWTTYTHSMKVIWTWSWAIELCPRFASMAEAAGKSKYGQIMERSGGGVWRKKEYIQLNYFLSRQ